MKSEQENMMTTATHKAHVTTLMDNLWNFRV